MRVHAVKVEWATNKDRLCSIRRRVFTDEQGIPAELDVDEFDETADHFLALNEIGQALGTARLATNGQIGRMAVLSDQRGRGIGKKLLEAALEQATQARMTRVFLHAQRSAEGFYRKSGFLPVGDEFLEGGIPHVEMVLELAIPFPAADATRGPVVRLSADIRPKPSTIQMFASETECREALLGVLRVARRHVVIVSAALARPLFGDDFVVGVLSEFARRNRQAVARVLIEDAKHVAEVNHPILELARRLPSKISIRRLPDDQIPARRSFVVADTAAVWLQPDLESYAGWADPNVRVEARRLVDEFDALFERSTDDPELRLLTL